ncbi:hypothetical protein CU048_09955 [Beijerinckiaceae bacterium]|nr:hypothetical protein CU048_09955 [Beijerinckiaceae bacterium]
MNLCSARMQGRWKLPALRRLRPTRGRGPALFLAMFAFLQMGVLHAAEAPCPTQGAASAVVSSVSERLELTLVDGRLIKLAGVDPPRPTPDDPALDTKTRDRLANWLSGHEIRFRAAEPNPDRWGRLIAFVFDMEPDQITPGPARMSVGEALLDAGLARYEPGAAARPCRSALLAAENGARAAGLGLWADPYYAVLAASDRQSFAEKAGTSVIVEGKVASVENRGSRAILTFGPRHGWDEFSVKILSRNIKAFDGAGKGLSDFIGKTLRVRGLLDTHFGPHIEISNPDEVELIELAPDATATRAGASTSLK